MAQVLGIIDLYWGGNRIDIKPGGSLKLGGMINTPVIYGQQVGRAQKMAHSEVNVKAIVKAGMTVTDLFGASLEQQLQVGCDTGQTFVWDTAFRQGELDITVGDSSEVDLKLVGGVPMEV